MSDLGPERRRMVAALVEQGIVRDGRVREALEAIPREAFVPDDQRAEAFVDAPLPIGGGQTISAPHMVAMMAEALDVRPGHRVLEVGGGSGYAAAVLARLVAPGGSVTSVELRDDLASRARRTLAPLGLPVDVVVGDGSQGHPGRAPYDRISVAAGAPDVPRPLVDQLRPEGVLVLPVGGRDEQELLRVTKRTEGPPAIERLGPVRFVPLLGRHGFPE